MILQFFYIDLQKKELHLTSRLIVPKVHNRDQSSKVHILLVCISCRNKFITSYIQGSYLAVGSVHRTVNIYDRHGELVDDISLPGSCTGLKWDAEGNTLAVIQVLGGRD